MLRSTSRLSLLLRNLSYRPPVRTQQSPFSSTSVNMSMTPVSAKEACPRELSPAIQIAECGT